MLIIDISSVLVYNTRMDKTYIQFRLWAETLKKLRYIYAATGESMIAIVERLADQELKRIQKEQSDGQKDT
jgi:hypothetical protein